MQNAGSLVKYQTPILINTVGGRNNKKATKKAGNADKQIVQTEDILNSILPPRSVLIMPAIMISLSMIIFLHNIDSLLDRLR